MKFALNVVALAVSVSLWTPPVQPLHNDLNELLLSVTSNDQVWAKYLNVGIKFESNKLPAAARSVLAGLKVLNKWPKPANEQRPGQDAEGRGQSHDDVVVAPALHVVTNVSSNHDEQGVAVKFALGTIVTAIKCNTLKYVLVQLHAIEEGNKLQNATNTSQPTDVWSTMINVLDKVFVFKESIDAEFEMYRLWELISNQDMTKQLPPEFKDFRSLVESTLNASCELNTFDEILKNMEFDSATESFGTATGVMMIFEKCQKRLTEMFNEIPISSMKLEVWESILKKPKFEESSEHKNVIE